RAAVEKSPSLDTLVRQAEVDLTRQVIAQQVDSQQRLRHIDANLGKLLNAEQQTALRTVEEFRATENARIDNEIHTALQSAFTPEIARMVSQVEADRERQLQDIRAQSRDALENVAPPSALAALLALQGQMLEGGGPAGAELEARIAAAMKDPELDAAVDPASVAEIRALLELGQKSAAQVQQQADKSLSATLNAEQLATLQRIQRQGYELEQSLDAQVQKRLETALPAAVRQQVSTLLGERDEVAAGTARSVEQALQKDLPVVHLEQEVQSIARSVAQRMELPTGTASDLSLDQALNKAVAAHVQAVRREGDNTLELPLPPVAEVKAVAPQPAAPTPAREAPAAPAAPDEPAVTSETPEPATPGDDTGAGKDSGDASPEAENATEKTDPAAIPDNTSVVENLTQEKVAEVPIAPAAPVVVSPITSNSGGSSGGGSSSGSSSISQGNTTNTTDKPASNGSASGGGTAGSSGGNNSTATPPVSVAFVNSAPANITLSNTFVAASRPSGAVLGQLSATDPDGNNITFLLSDNQSGRFTLNGTWIGLNDTPTKVHGNYTLTVTAQDSLGASSNASFNVTVIGFSADDIPDNQTSVANLTSAARSNYRTAFAALYNTTAGGTLNLTEETLEGFIVGKLAQQLTANSTFAYNITDVVKRLDLDINATRILLTAEVGVVDALYSRLPANSTVRQLAETLFDTVTPYMNDTTATVQFRIYPVINGSDISFDSTNSTVHVLHESSLVPNVSYQLSDLITYYNGIRSTLSSEAGVTLFEGGGGLPPLSFLVDVLGDQDTAEGFEDNITATYPSAGTATAGSSQSIPTSQRVDYYFPALVSAVSIGDGVVTLTRSSTTP
ncbi:MAG: hypothetical protein H7831_08880, partial [Magnetococcus sp. WYHC-3]